MKPPARLLDRHLAERIGIRDLVEHVADLPLLRGIDETARAGVEPSRKLSDDTACAFPAVLMTWAA